MQKLVLLAVVVVAATLVPAPRASAQVAGEATLGVTVEEMKLVVLGWSAKKRLLDADVYNDKGEKIGRASCRERVCHNV